MTTTTTNNNTATEFVPTNNAEACELMELGLSKNQVLRFIAGVDFKFNQKGDVSWKADESAVRYVSNEVSFIFRDEYQENSYLIEQFTDRRDGMYVGESVVTPETIAMDVFVGNFGK